ncbi:hypothetical protein K8I28_04490 [bacterium]|nr:hypothetical protein [bacterium]
MKVIRQIILWIIALLLTFVFAHYQRQTGPTHPIEGTAKLGQTTFDYSLKRSQGGTTDHRVEIPVRNKQIKGVVLWKHYKLDEETRSIPMYYEDGKLVASLPHQPPAGKLEYQVVLDGDQERVLLPETEPAIIRFKGSVPLTVLIPHIIFMFSAMLVATRTGIGALLKEKVNTLSWITLILLTIGGLILGPIVQKYAFDAYWTGWPFGEDLTDNKTLAAVIAWVLSVWRTNRSKSGRQGRWWVVGATVVLLGVYLIPHSMRGSELDYSTIPADSLEYYSGAEKDQLIE